MEGTHGRAHGKAAPDPCAIPWSLACATPGSSSSSRSIPVLACLASLRDTRLPVLHRLRIALHVCSSDAAVARDGTPGKGRDGCDPMDVVQDSHECAPRQRPPAAIAQAVRTWVGSTTTYLLKGLQSMHTAPDGSTAEQRMLWMCHMVHLAAWLAPATTTAMLASERWEPVVGGIVKLLLSACAHEDAETCGASVLARLAAAGSRLHAVTWEAPGCQPPTLTDYVRHVVAPLTAAWGLASTHVTAQLRDLLDASLCVLPSAMAEHSSRPKAYRVVTQRVVSQLLCCLPAMRRAGCNHSVRAALASLHACLFSDADVRLLPKSFSGGRLASYPSHLWTAMDAALQGPITPTPEPVVAAAQALPWLLQCVADAHVTLAPALLLRLHQSLTPLLPWNGDHSQGDTESGAALCSRAAQRCIASLWHTAARLNVRLLPPRPDHDAARTEHGDNPELAPHVLHARLTAEAGAILSAITEATPASLSADQLAHMLYALAALVELHFDGLEEALEPMWQWLLLTGSNSGSGGADTNVAPWASHPGVQAAAAALLAQLWQSYAAVRRLPDALEAMCAAVAPAVPALYLRWPGHCVGPFVALAAVQSALVQPLRRLPLLQVRAVWRYLVSQVPTRAPLPQPLPANACLALQLLPLLWNAVPLSDALRSVLDVEASVGPLHKRSGPSSSRLLQTSCRVVHATVTAAVASKGDASALDCGARLTLTHLAASAYASWSAWMTHLWPPGSSDVVNAAYTGHGSIGADTLALIVHVPRPRKRASRGVSDPGFLDLLQHCTLVHRKGDPRAAKRKRGGGGGSGDAVARLLVTPERAATVLTIMQACLARLRVCHRLFQCALEPPSAFVSESRALAGWCLDALCVHDLPLRVREGLWCLLQAESVGPGAGLGLLLKLGSPRDQGLLFRRALVSGRSMLCGDAVHRSHTLCAVVEMVASMASLPAGHGEASTSPRGGKRDRQHLASHGSADAEGEVRLGVGHRLGDPDTWASVQRAQQVVGECLRHAELGSLVDPESVLEEHVAVLSAFLTLPAAYWSSMECPYGLSLLLLRSWLPASVLAKPWLRAWSRYSRHCAPLAMENPYADTVSPDVARASNVCEPACWVSWLWLGEPVAGIAPPVLPSPSDTHVLTLMMARCFAVADPAVAACAAQACMSRIQGVRSLLVQCVPGSPGRGSSLGSAFAQLSAVLTSVCQGMDVALSHACVDVGTTGFDAAAVAAAPKPTLWLADVLVQSVWAELQDVVLDALALVDVVEPAYASQLAMAVVAGLRWASWTKRLALWDQGLRGPVVLARALGAVRGLHEAHLLWHRDTFPAMVALCMHHEVLADASGVGEAVLAELLRCWDAGDSEAGVCRAIAVLLRYTTRRDALVQQVNAVASHCVAAVEAQGHARAVAPRCRAIVPLVACVQALCAPSWDSVLRLDVHREAVGFTDQGGEARECPTGSDLAASEEPRTGPGAHGPCPLSITSVTAPHATKALAKARRAAVSHVLHACCALVTRATAFALPEANTDSWPGVEDSLRASGLSVTMARAFMSMNKLRQVNHTHVTTLLAACANLIHAAQGWAQRWRHQRDVERASPMVEAMQRRGVRSGSGHLTTAQARRALCVSWRQAQFLMYACLRHQGKHVIHHLPTFVGLVTNLLSTLANVVECQAPDTETHVSDAVMQSMTQAPIQWSHVSVRSPLDGGVASGDDVRVFTLEDVVMTDLTGPQSDGGTAETQALAAARECASMSRLLEELATHEGVVRKHLAHILAGWLRNRAKHVLPAESRRALLPGFQALLEVMGDPDKAVVYTTANRAGKGMFKDLLAEPKSVYRG